MKFLRCFFAVCLVAIEVEIQPSGAQFTVTVDPAIGNDANCLSLQDLASNSSGNGSFPDIPCRTLNRALGSVQENCSTLSCSLDGSQRSLDGSQRSLDGSQRSLSGFDGAIIRLADGEHRLSRCIRIVDSFNISFEAINEGEPVIMCANDSPTDYDNLFFCGAEGISFQGIRFEGCGPLSSNVFFNHSSQITFENCVFRGNFGCPLQIRFSTGIRLSNCSFIENENRVEAMPDTENTTLIDIYDATTTSGALTVFSMDQTTDILIEQCVFTSNVASVNAPNNTRPVLLKANGHGGAILIRLVNCSNSYVTIERSVFESNEAEVDGGAVYVSISEYSSANRLTFRDNNFTANRVLDASGGAISINSFNFTSSNIILVEGCRFSANHGDSGGGFSMALYNSDLRSSQSRDRLVFNDSVFSSNTAGNEGTAVGLFALVHVDQVGFPVYFHDCTFVNNTSLESSGDTSAIAAFRFPTVFSGYNHFEENLGGGITLLNTRMRVTPNSSLLFLRNKAVFGGGIAMDDRCLLELSNDVNMTFEGNIATESGGGIYVEFPPIRFVVDIFNRLCFLQYNDGSGIDAPPQDWNNVSVHFKGNRARLSGAAIFASDMQQCGWLGSNDTSNDTATLIFNPPSHFMEDFPDYPFQYVDNELFPEGMDVARLESSHLATSPSNIITMLQTEQHSMVQPGESLQINLLATDQLGNSREAIWSVEAPSREPNLDALSANYDTHSYRVPSAAELPGVMPGQVSSDSTSGPPAMGGTTTPAVQNPQGDFVLPENFSSSFTLNFSLLRTLGSVEALELHVMGCHPGYSYDSGNQLCVCDSANNNNILRCDRDMRYLYLREGYWGGVREKNGIRTLVTTSVQPGFVNCDTQGRLPGCLFKFDQPNDQCIEGRKGVLCGECTENRGVTLDLRECSSTTCYWGLGLFLFLCVAVVVVSLLILLFNIEVPNELKGFIFYAQVVGLVYGPYVVVQTDVNITKYTSVIRTLLNLLGLSVPLPLCLSESLPAHYVALLGYISPTLAILCVLLFTLGARFIRYLGSHSALKGITFLSFFIYKYVADTSFILISCIETEDSGLVFQYDGSQSCLAPEFLVFFLIGVCLVTFFVVPTPVVVSYICVYKPQRFKQYADVLTKGIRPRHHWWGGWDIGRRLLFVFIGYFIVFLRPSVVLFFMSLTSLCVLIVHLFSKPFQKMYINVIEAAILLNLLMVTVAFLDPSNTPVPFGFSTVLLLLPYAYAIGYLLYFLLLRRLWTRFGRVGGAEGVNDGGSVVPADSTATADGRSPSHTHSGTYSSAGEDSGTGSSHPRTQSSVVGGQVSSLTNTQEMDVLHYREPLLDDS